MFLLLFSAFSFSAEQMNAFKKYLFLLFKQCKNLAFVLVCELSAIGEHL